RAPRQTSGSNGPTVEVEQTAAKAILTWRNFNVGKNTTLYFNQTAGTAADGRNDWIVLNRVLDPSGAPSQILRQLKAEGHAYVVNQNGIVFTGSSQVNVATLLASSLGITNDQFRFGILYQASSDPQIVAPAFVGTPGQTKPVIVEAGATIATTTG